MTSSEQFLRSGLVAAIFALLAMAARAETAQPGLAVSNTADLLSNVRGGIKTGTRLLDKVDVSASWPGDSAGMPGFEAFLDLQGTSAANFNDLTGSAQGISNIDAPAGVRIFSAWAAQSFAKGGVKAGIIDLNSEFDMQPTGLLFLNPSHGIGPDFSQSGLNGPSIFPSTGLGLVGWWLPGDDWELKTGLFDGRPGNPDHPGRTEISISGRDGMLVTGEIRKQVTPDFVISAGGWSYSAAFDTVDHARKVHGNSGLHAIADALLTDGLHGWVRLGTANSAMNAIAYYAGSGLVLAAPWNPDSDQLGLAVGHVRFGGAARRAAIAAGQAPNRTETTVEVTYSKALNKNIALQPDIQYVLAPGGDPTLPDALVLGLRTTLSWSN